MTVEPNEALNSTNPDAIDLDQHDDTVPGSLPRRAELPSSLTTNAQKLGADGLTYTIGFIQITFNATTGDAVAGMLVTDNTGIPLEFLITSAVRPTRPQRILYGKRLNSFIANDLCGAQLLNDIKMKPKVVFVQDEYMLGLADHTLIPVLVLRQIEQLGTLALRPTVIPPRHKPEYADAIDLSSLDPDMVDAFERIEKCREVLAARDDEYKL